MCEWSLGMDVRIECSLCFSTLAVCDTGVAFVATVGLFFS